MTEPSLTPRQAEYGVPPGAFAQANARAAPTRPLVPGRPRGCCCPWRRRGRQRLAPKTLGTCGGVRGRVGICTWPARARIACRVQPAAGSADTLHVSNPVILAQTTLLGGWTEPPSREDEAGTHGLRRFILGGAARCAGEQKPVLQGQLEAQRGAGGAPAVGRPSPWTISSGYTGHMAEFVALAAAPSPARRAAQEGDGDKTERRQEV